MAAAHLLVRAAYWRLRYRQLYLGRDIELFADLRAEQVPQRKNRLSLSCRSDVFGVPILKLQWSPCDQDERTFRHAARQLRTYWTRSGLAEINPIEWQCPEADGGWRFVDRSIDCLHPSGTTRMGTNPRTSVVDSNLRCHHIANLSIASASTFPSAGSANPSLTVMQIALRAAEARLNEA